MDGDSYGVWKSNIPDLYDSFLHHNLVWPSLSCRWGPKVDEGKSRFRQHVYLTEQTYDDYPNTLICVECELVKPLVAVTGRLDHFDEDKPSQMVRKIKSIIHPGEVNKVRELPGNSRIVATHTDKPEVYVWNMETQPSRSTAPNPRRKPSVPDLTLTGHTDVAQYALALSRNAPFVLSGGQDKQVIVWDINEPLSATEERETEGTTVQALARFEGHDAAVEDVQFRPSSPQEFCSVGDDKALIFWDARNGRKPAVKVTRAHDADVHCVDWNSYDDNYTITGSADQSVRLFDRRKLVRDDCGSPVQEFKGHQSPVLCVQWCPAKKSVFGSSGEDGAFNLWESQSMLGSSKESDLFFQHAGHRGTVTDFHWNPWEPWLMLSISQDSSGGGTMQIWRINDMLHRAQEEVVSELINLNMAG